MERIHLSIAEVITLHERVVRASGGLLGVRDQGLLESAVMRPQTGYYADVIEEAAALLESLVQNHPFHDGNKRTAFIVTDAFLKANGFRIQVHGAKAEKFFLENLAAGTFRFAATRDWLLQVTEPYPRKG
jgi:death-on-curing protein